MIWIDMNFMQLFTIYISDNTLKLLLLLYDHFFVLKEQSAILIPNISCQILWTFPHGPLGVLLFVCTENKKTSCVGQVFWIL